MSVDISAGDSTPILSQASIIKAATAINRWFKYVEVSDSVAIPLIFNKQLRTTGHLEILNTASDQRGLEIYTTNNVKTGGFRVVEGTNLTYLETIAGFPLYLNAGGASNRLSLRVNDAEIAQVSATGVGVGMGASEKLSVGTTVNGTSSTLGVYALTAAGAQSVARLTQDAATGNTTLSYGAGAGGTNKLFILSGNAGGMIYATPGGNLALNNPGIVYGAYSGARYVTIKGDTGPAAVELVSGAADAGGIITGSIYGTDANSTAADKRLGAFEFGTDGTTANNRGGLARLLIKQNGASGLTEVWRVSQSAQLSIGANAPILNEVVRVHKALGAQIIVSDNAGYSYISSIPVSSKSELVLGANATEAVRIDQNLRVGINTTTPQAKLDVGGAVTAGLAQAVFARGADINFTLGVRNGSGVNADGEVQFQFGTEYTGAGTTLTSGFKFIRGGQSNNMQLDLYADSTRIASHRSNAITYLTQTFQASSMGRISTQTNVTTAGFVMQPSSAGVDDTDGAFITFRNKAGTKAFSLGMDLDGEFRVGGGSIGTNAYKVLHEGYNPGAMNNRGVVNWADADLYRATGTYQLRNSGNTASYSLIEFADIGGSTARVQFTAWYGGGDPLTSPDELYFRTARDTQTNWDSMPLLQNRIWHSSNLVDPITKKTDYITPNGTYLKAVGVPSNQGETFWSTPAYGTNQGDNRTHFGYLYDVASNIWHNYIRGNRTITEGVIATGPYPFITGRAARYLATYAGTNAEFGITLNNLVDTGTAISFCTGATQSFGGTTQGTISVTANAVQYNVSSDRRLKKNIKMAPSALEKLMDVDVVSFDFKKDDEHVEHGFIAQQLAQHVPEAVTRGNDGEIENPEDVWQVDSSKLIPLLVKGQQQLTLQLAEAMTKIGELMREIEVLKRIQR